VFSVLFEVHPKSEQWDDYLGYARMLRPELEKVDGFVDNIRYRSLTRGGWILSLSGWRDEKSVVRGRRHRRRHGCIITRIAGRRSAHRAFRQSADPKLTVPVDHLHGGELGRSHTAGLQMT
jgi:heme-degrading monooxygenase HmoA